MCSTACVSSRGRVVKASDSKSDGVTCTGSNPVDCEVSVFFEKSVSLYLVYNL